MVAVAQELPLVKEAIVEEPYYKILNTSPQPRLAISVPRHPTF